MTAESFTRWTCDECGAQCEGELAADWWADARGRLALCPECRGAGGQVRALLLDLESAEREILDWKTRWRSVRADVDRLTAELARVKRDQRAA